MGITGELSFFAANLNELDKRIRVGAVSYLNTRPLLYGFDRAGLMNRIELVEAYPSKIASMLLNDQIDVGLVPVAIIPQMKEAHIVTDYCIASEGEVASVAIFSEQPMEQLDRLLLDYQSRTSVNLATLLLKEFWKKDLVLEAAREDYRNDIKGTTGGVVIGDRALEQRKISRYTYDLGLAWKQHTGLPFVFAAWVANKPLEADFLQTFNLANGYGVDHLEKVVAENPYDTYDLQTYYSKNINYHLTDDKRNGLALFLEKLSANSIIR